MESRKDALDLTESLSNILEHMRDMRQQWIKLQRPPNVFICHSNAPDIYKCGNCDFETNLKVSLTHHLTLNHKGLTNQNQFKIVLRQCEYCDFQTYSMLLLLNHCFKCDKRENLDNKINNWLECEQCSYKTMDKCYLRRHIRRMHSTDFDLFHREKCSSKTKNNLCFRQYTNLSSYKADSTKIEWFHCDRCEFKTKRKGILKIHIANIHEYSANIVWYHCDTCENKSKTESDLNVHEALIHTDSPDGANVPDIVWYNCENCEYKSKKKDKLKRHIASIHTDSSNIVWYQCDQCEHKTKRKDHLKRHVTSVHTDSAEIVWHHCDYCEYKCKRKDKLKPHITNKHTNPANIVHCVMESF